MWQGLRGVDSFLGTVVRPVSLVLRSISMVRRRINEKQKTRFHERDRCEICVHVVNKPRSRLVEPRPAGGGSGSAPLMRE